jgi:hypothetical protein
MNRPVRRLSLIVAPLALVATLAACGAPPPPPAPPESVAPAPGIAQVPGDVLDLQNWKLTLPTGAEGDPTEVQPPQLGTFSDGWFRLNDTRDGVVFTANAGGVTTKGSSYPRSELREMSGNALAAWSNVTGTHTMSLRQAITQLPEAKPHVVAAQIHDADTDIVMIRLEGETLMVESNDGDDETILDPAYVLGTPYNLRITAAGGRVEIYYNGAPAAEIPASGSGWYFKAGSYVQSNSERGDAADAVGEVVIYALSVEHSP